MLHSCTSKFLSSEARVDPTGLSACLVGKQHRGFQQYIVASESNSFNFDLSHPKKCASFNVLILRTVDMVGTRHGCLALML